MVNDDYQKHVEANQVAFKLWSKAQGGKNPYISQQTKLVQQYYYYYQTKQEQLRLEQLEKARVKSQEIAQATQPAITEQATQPKIVTTIQDKFKTTRRGIAKEAQANEQLGAFKLGGAGTGGNILVQLGYEREAESGRAYKIDKYIGTTPKDWAQGVESGALTSQALSMIGGFKGLNYIYNTGRFDRGIYRYNKEQITTARILADEYTRFQKNPESFKGVMGYKETTTELGTTYELDKTYFEGIINNKAIQQYSREQFQLLPKETRSKLKLNQWIGDATRVKEEFRIGLGEIYIKSFSNLKTDKPFKMPMDDYQKSLFDRPLDKDFITPYGVIKGGTIGLMVASGSLSLSSSIKAYGFSSGTKDFLINLSPVKPAQTRFYAKVNYLDSTIKQTSFKFGDTTLSRTTFKGRQALPTKDLFNAPKNFKVNIEQRGVTTNIGDKGVSYSQVSTTQKVPFVEYRGGNFYFGRTVRTTSQVFKTEPSSVYLGGYQTTDLRTGQSYQVFKTTDSITGIKENYRLVVGQDVYRNMLNIKGVYQGRLKPYIDVKIDERGVNVLSRVKGKGYDLTGFTDSKSFKFSGGGSSTTQTGTTTIQAQDITFFKPPTFQGTTTKSLNILNTRKDFISSSSTATGLQTILKTDIKPASVTRIKSFENVVLTDTETTKTDSGTKNVPVIIAPNFLDTKTSTSTITSIINIPAIREDIKQDNKTKQGYLFRSITGQRQGNYKDGFNFVGFGGGGFGFNIPPILPFDTSSFGRVKGSRKRPKYTPSFAALTFNIRGTKPKKQIGLLGVRPIPKGFKWSY